ncbi:MAG: diguanylate cyclase [Sinimarinibacterium sp.]
MSASAAPVPIVTAEWAPPPGRAAGQAPDPNAQSQFRPFDAARMHRFERNPDGLWLRVLPQSGSWPEGPLVLTVHRVVFGTTSLQWDGASRPLRADILDPLATGLAGHSAPVFDLPPDLPKEAPLLLHFESHPTLAPSATITVEPLADYLRRDALWVALASACLAAMAAMALTAFVFTLLLGDRAYLFYALYLSCFIVLEVIATGYLFTVLRWHAWAPAIGAIGKLVTIASVVSACLFLMDFVRMRDTAPRIRRVIQTYVAVFGTTIGLGLLPIPALQELARVMVNPMLAFGALILPVAALIVAARGSRYGLYFLLGWLPLMAVTFMSSVQVSGAFAEATWLMDSLLVAGTFEALVLAIGLADRALAHRHQFHSAQQLSMTDPLTGLLNRRAFEAQFAALIAQAQADGLRLYVLFIDLDHFKSLNDCFGHRAGDQALSAVAGAMRRIAPGGSLQCRYGGEEFVLAMSVTRSADALTTAEMLRSAVVSLGIPVNQEGGVLTLSIGLARYHTGDSAAMTIEAADRAMYRAKSGGRNRVMEVEAPG